MFDWLKKKETLDINKYDKNKSKAYWEIYYEEKPDNVTWTVRIYSRKTNKILVEKTDSSKDKVSAKNSAEYFVHENMKNFEVK